MKKQSEQIREQIGNLIYEQQLYQLNGNDDMLDRVDTKIANLRCKLLLVEANEKKAQSKCITDDNSN